MSNQSFVKLRRHTDKQADGRTTALRRTLTTSMNVTFRLDFSSRLDVAHPFYCVRIWYTTSTDQISLESTQNVRRTAVTHTDIDSCETVAVN